MLSAISIILFLIFLLLSVLHGYWGFGGKWAGDAVVPTKDSNTRPNMPGPLPTFAVAFSLLGFGFFVLAKSEWITIGLPAWVSQYGLWAIAGIFIIRAIGEFKYVGLFKKVKHTEFGKNDTKLYTPLCLAIGVLTIVLALHT